MTPLNQKLVRDLWRIKSQAIAIGLVIALGVLMLVMMHGLVNTLEETRLAYYDRYRLADVFAPVNRAPTHTLKELAAIPGVAAVQGRVMGEALIDLPEVNVPLRARAISLPDTGSPTLNDIFLTDGRMMLAGHVDEIILLKGFAEARQLTPGDSLTVTMNGARRTFSIVGLAQSPEFFYSTAPGELAADDSRFAVIWVGESALAAAYDMEGAFNEALLSLEPGAGLAAVTNAADKILYKFGSLGAYGLENQLSNRFISEEIDGLKASAVGVPPLFLAVAAFLLYIVISRMVQSEREQIGLLKAFGYSSAEVSTHYLKLVLVIAIGGALAGIAMGIAAGRGMAELYQSYFKFPFIVFEVDPVTFYVGLLISIGTATAASLLVLRSIFLLTPAVAMRPPLPPDYRNALKLPERFQRILDQPSKMVLRRVFRQPGRMFAAVTGIACGMALSAGMISVMSGFDRALDVSFSVLDRSDANVVFTHSLTQKSIIELAQVPGVIAVEPYRSVPVIFRHGRHHYQGGIEGLVDNPRLYRALDTSLQPIPLMPNGIVLSKPIADILQAAPGDWITIDVREGRRPLLQVPVAAVANTLLGSPVYMQLSALNHYLKEPEQVSGAFLRLDTAQRDQVYRAIKNMPAVAGISLKLDSRISFEKMMDQGAGAMRYIMALIAGVITFGIVFNSARIAYAERERDLASLRVIGFTKGETAFVLLGELTLVTLIALPIGAALGYYLSLAISEGFSTDIYQIQPVYTSENYGIAGLAVIFASLVSGWLVKRDIDRIDLVSALKSKE